MESFSLAKWKDIELDEIYHPTYQFYLKIFMDFTFAVSSILYPLTAYIILTQSTPQMGTFKTTIFMQLTFNIIYEFTLFLFNPVIHFPLPFLSYQGYFEVGRNGVIHILAFLLFLVVGGISAFIVSLLYRVKSLFTHQYDIKKHYYLTIFGHLFATIAISSTLIASLYAIFENSRESVESYKVTIPALAQLHFALPSTAGIDPGKNGTAVIIFLFFNGIWVATFVASFSILNLIFVIRLRKIKKLITKETFTLHRMLHRTLLIQMIAAIIFMLIPMCILSFTFLVQQKIGSWIVNLALPLSSIHLLVDCPCILYFIKPYRLYVKKKLFCKKNRQTVVVNSHQPSQFSVL